MKQLKGTRIESVRPHYENICISVKNSSGKYESYFITSDDLVTILSEFDFNVEKKRTRTWLSVNIDEWRIEKFNEPRTY
jgi:hypothetical protein